MATISITRKENNVFLVLVEEGGSSTEHKVTVPPEYFERFAGKFATPEDFVRASFAFLLEREPKESILRAFSIDVISRYFPKYERTIGS